MSQLQMRRHNLAGLPPIPALGEGCSLRRGALADRAGIAEVLAKAFDDATWDADRVQRELFEDECVHGTFIVVFREKPVATASVQIQPDRYPRSGVLHWVATDPEHRGQRLGAAVSLAVLHVFVEMGCRDAVLLTDDERLAAIKTYLGLGFLPEPTDGSHSERWAAVSAALEAAK